MWEDMTAVMGCGARARRAGAKGGDVGGAARLLAASAGKRMT